MQIKPGAASSGGGIKFGHLLGKLVNRPLLTTPRRALTLFGVLAPRAGIRADDMVAWTDEEGGGPILLSSLVAQASTAPRLRGPKDDGKAYRTQGGVAIIRVAGDLVHDLGSLDPWCGMTGYDGICAKLDLAEADPDVRGAVLMVDSPGGEVSGVAACGDRIVQFQRAKPLRTVYADAGYSAACWLGSQAERVYAPRTGGSGSIGVVTLHVDLSAAYEEWGVKVTVLHAGAHKADGHSFAPLPEQVAADIVAELEALRGHFADAVAEGRGIDRQAVLDTEARCLSADEALQLGLIDEVLNPDDALAQFIADLDASDDGISVSIPAAPAAITAKGEIMAKKQAAGETAKSARIKVKGRKAGTKAEDEGEEPEADAEDPCEGCRHCGKASDEEPCSSCPDNPEKAEGDDAKASEDDEDMEDDEEEEDDEAKASAQGTKARIQAILTAPEAQACPTLAQKLAFNTGMSAKKAVSVLKAAAADAQSGSSDTFAAAMASHAGPKLGTGPSRTDKSPKAALSSAMDRAIKNANIG